MAKLEAVEFIPMASVSPDQSFLLIETENAQHLLRVDCIRAVYTSQKTLFVDYIDCPKHFFVDCTPESATDVFNKIKGLLESYILK